MKVFCGICFQKLLTICYIFFRLQRLKLVKPEKASAVEESLIKAATNQQLKAKVTDKQLQEMLAGVSDDSSVNKKKIIVQRKKYADDSESDNDDDLL